MAASGADDLEGKRLARTYVATEWNHLYYNRDTARTGNNVMAIKYVSTNCQTYYIV
jgi:hypothetical protein